MSKTHYLKELQPSHYLLVREVYRDAIENLGSAYYTEQQIDAWSSLAILPGVLDNAIEKGKGWISFNDQTIAAFAVRYPLDRVALLYCRAGYARKGHATALLQQIELEAQAEGQKKLVTEASIFSYHLFIKLGWIIITPEIIQIAGIDFNRFCMQKTLKF